MKYDATMSVAYPDRYKARLAIQYLFKNASPRKLYIMTPKRCFRYFEGIHPDVVLIDEDIAIPNVTLSAVRDYLSGLEPPNYKAGWYFQQFLKMAVCHQQDVLDYYLIWDADTVLLQPINFFSEQDKMYITKGVGIHEPYFDTHRAILGECHRAEFSFIAQHIMVRTPIMRDLLDSIKPGSLATGEWVWTILGSLSNRTDVPGFCSSNEGRCPEFSEYETYGTYVHNNHRELLEYRHLNWYRNGSSIHRFPTSEDLSKFGKKHEYVAFESHFLPREAPVLQRLWINRLKPTLVGVGAKALVRHIQKRLSY